MNPFERLREQVLVLRYQAGDATALEELVERHYGPLLYFVRRMLGSSADAEDVLQDTWLAVLRNLRKLRNPEAFSAWLYRIARNRIYEQLRKSKPVLPLSEEVETAVTPEENTDEFSADDAARVHQCLDKLRPEHREVLILRFLEHMSYQEIEAVVGCSLGTVRSRLHYAKRALRKEMEETDDER